MRINNTSNTSNTAKSSTMSLASEIHYDVSERACFLCMKKEEETVRLELCGFCGNVWSCSKDHYEVHRSPARGGTCFPFVIKKSEEKGRFMVATRDISPLELILSEEPAVVGPYTATASSISSSKSKLSPCLQCLKKTDRPCSVCRLPVCSENCQRGDLHREECQFIAGIKTTAISRALQKPQDRIGGGGGGWQEVCITPLRMLLKKRSDPKTFAKIDMLLDHAEDKAVTSNNGGNQINFQLMKVILLIRELCQMQEFSHQEILRMIGILRTNGMKLEPSVYNCSGSPGVALYPIYCLINHACYNNTNYVKFPDLHLELRSQLPIRKGQEIFTRYISSTIGNVRRRQDIRRYWFFDCECDRCRDPTEMGTLMSALRCLSCDSGFLLPVDGLDYESDWACDGCSKTVKFKTVDEVLATIEKQIGDIDAATIEELEEMLFHYQKLLHPNHFILTDIAHNLIHLYAAKAPDLKRPEKERKIQLCLSVLDTLTRVDPGYTKWRGTLLQELIHPLMIISREDHDSGRLSDREFQRRLAFCSRKLKEAKLCLRGGFTPVEEYIGGGGGQQQEGDQQRGQ